MNIYSQVNIYNKVYTVKYAKFLKLFIKSIYMYLSPISEQNL